jgi:hypothetical protein
VLTVGVDQAGVEARLWAGELACPAEGCAGQLGPWGYARERVVRGEGGRRRLRPRRGRCRGCGATHVLLPRWCLARRADAAAVVGAGLVLAAAGWGFRRVARRLGRPEATVRGWLRRFSARAEAVRVAFTVLAGSVAAEAVALAPAGSAVADAVNAVLAVAAAAAVRWPAVGAVSPWELACAATGGRLLAPGTTLIMTGADRKIENTTRP